MSLTANRPGAHRYIGPTLAAAAGYIYSSKFMRSKPAKQMVSSGVKNILSSSKISMPAIDDGDVLMRGRSKSSTRTGRNITPSPRRSASVPAAPRKRKRQVTVRSKSKSRVRGRSMALKGGVMERQKRLSKRKIDNSWQLYGSVYKGETSGNIDSSQCQYIGHNTCPHRSVLLSGVRCIIKELFKQAGHHISVWDQIFGQVMTDKTWVIGYSWFATDTTNMYGVDTDPTASSAEVNIGTSDTYSTIALNLFDSFQTNFSNINHDVFEIVLRRESNTNQTEDIVARIFPRQFFMDFKVASHLKIQNATFARVIISEGTDDDSTENVNANPLTYTVYEKRGANGLRYTFKRAISGATGLYGFVGNQYTGQIEFDPTDATTSQPKLYKAPPPSSMGIGSNYYRSTKGKFGFGHLDPGHIKSSYLTSTFKMSFNQMINTFKFYWQVNNAPVQISPVGAVRVFALEHAIKVAGDPAVTCQWQLDLTIMSKYKYHPRIMSEVITDVST